VMADSQSAMIYNSRQWEIFDGRCWRCAQRKNLPSGLFHESRTLRSGGTYGCSPVFQDQLRAASLACARQLSSNATIRASSRSSATADHWARSAPVGSASLSRVDHAFDDFSAVGAPVIFVRRPVRSLHGVGPLRLESVVSSRLTCVGQEWRGCDHVTAKQAQQYKCDARHQGQEAATGTGRLKVARIRRHPDGITPGGHEDPGERIDQICAQRVRRATPTAAASSAGGKIEVQPSGAPMLSNNP